MAFSRTTALFVSFYLSALCFSFSEQVGNVSSADTAEGDVATTSEAPTVTPTGEAKVTPQLPSLSATYSGILSQVIYSKNCYSDGENLCTQAPAAAVRDYLRTLSSRLLAVSTSHVNWEDHTLRRNLSDLGCLSVAIIDLREIQATVGLFRQGVVSRLRLDKNLLHEFTDECMGQITPVAFHQHERSTGLVPRGQLNTNDSCGATKTGGHHDPGYACGPVGGSACKNLNIPASSALKGTSLFTGEYQCTPAIYQRRPFSCHAGDLSGKFGVGRNVSPDATRPDFRLMASDSHGDNPCVSAQAKHSLVVHCHSTNFRLACAPFQRIETAGRRLPQLLADLIRTARNSVAYSLDQSSLLASLLLVQEVEARIQVLEDFLPYSTPEDEHYIDSVDKPLDGH